MEAAADFKVTKIEKSRLEGLNLENVPFGKYFTDHMFMATYENGVWSQGEILPYGPISFTPALTSLHYGQAIFEGIKAYKDPNGNVSVFRGSANYHRFNMSARRMEMPEVPEEVFVGGMNKLIETDADWIPNFPDHALYIRPVMFGTDEAIGVRPSTKYIFAILLCPTGPYYPKPMRIYVEENFTRAVKGGVGYSKNAGNYGLSMHPTAIANAQGYDQVLWMDGAEHKYVQECGTMNVFFIIDNIAVTPGLEDGTILAGVTRDSVITILKELGYGVEERPIAIEEIANAYDNGKLQEVFGTGTAAVISKIKELRYKNKEMHFDTDNFPISAAVKKRMDEIKYGHGDDTYGWLEPIK